MKTSHIAIVVRNNLEEKIEFWKRLLDTENVDECDIMGMKTIIIRGAETAVELLYPLIEECPIKDSPEGFHHITFSTKDLDSVLDRTKDSVVKHSPKIEFERLHEAGTITFIDSPEKSGNVLVELAQLKEKE